MADYDRRDCTHCNTTGHAHDPTNADKVNVHPDAGTCTTCRGRGYTLHLIPPPEVLAAMQREHDAIRATYTGGTGDIPDWMC